MTPFQPCNPYFERLHGWWRIVIFRVKFDYIFLTTICSGFFGGFKGFELV